MIQKKIRLSVAYLTYPAQAGVTVGVNNLSIVHKSSNGVTIAFPDVCKTPAPPAPSVPIPYPNIKVTETSKTTKKTKIDGDKVMTKARKGDILTYALYGDSLENIISAEVCTGCLKNNNFKTTLEPVAKGQKNVTVRKLTITYLGEKNQHFQINFRRDMVSEPIFSREYNLPEKEPIPYPVLGSDVYEINPKATINNPYQLIKIETKEDLQKIRTYLNEIIKIEGIRSFNTDRFAELYYNPSKTTYVFISSQHDKYIYKKPYLKDGNIWLEGVEKNPALAPHFSTWIFYVPKNMKFRIRIKSGDFDIESGRLTLLSERFKKGEKKSENAGDFNIVSSGEYYHEDKLVFTQKGVEKKSEFGVKSYLNSIAAEKGSLFGFAFVYKGRTPKNYTFKIIHPEFPTVKGKEKTEYEFDILCKYNKEDNLLWQFSEEPEMVPGKWIFQITDNNKLIYQKDFTVKLPLSRIDTKLRDNLKQRVPDIKSEEQQKSLRP
jgi:hypothetical protein